jgi:phospholipid N-methyltransferase
MPRTASNGDHTETAAAAKARTGEPSMTRDDRTSCPAGILGEFLRDPRHVGAVAASSPHLAREICSHIGLETARRVVELGPGTGAFTAEILRRLAPGARLVAVERNPAFAEDLRRRWPQLDVAGGSAEDLASLVAGRLDGPADCVICGLPWSVFAEALQDQILHQIRSVLRPGGLFTTFAYLQGLALPGGRRFAGKLGGHFRRVRRSRVVWRNLPPAFAYRCVRGG